MKITGYIYRAVGYNINDIRTNLVYMFCVPVVFNSSSTSKDLEAIGKKRMTKH